MFMRLGELCFFTFFLALSSKLSTLSSGAFLLSTDFLMASVGYVSVNFPPSFRPWIPFSLIFIGEWPDLLIGALEQS